jgi:hypothetical protein
VFVVVLICLRLQRGRPVYFGDGEIFRLGGGTPTLPPPGKPALPSPGKPTLPPPGTPQIGRSNPPLTTTRHRTLPDPRRSR